MLAKSGRPFDSEQHLFEIKWDGIRALGRVDRGRLELLSRRHRELTGTYPELDFLRALPAGTVIDGEIIAVRNGRPDFESLLSRHQASGTRRIRDLAIRTPVSYVAFDLLYKDTRSLMPLPLRERRNMLEDIVADTGHELLLFSDGITGPGKKFFDEACERQLEGVMAKRLDSPYLPGKRSDTWQKIKRRQRLHCLVLGFVPKGPADFKSLLLGSDQGGKLCFVGRVGSGIRDAVRAHLNPALRARARSTPLVDCPERAVWVEPGIYCTVSFLERTRSGMLRTPVFEGLIEEE